MGRPGLSRHPKFLRVSSQFGKHQTLGILELLWQVGYENGDDRIGSPGDVEAACEWDPVSTGDMHHNRGDLFVALRDAGANIGASGFIEERPPGSGIWCIHDLMDHAPDYVQKRAEREANRKQKSADWRTKLSEIRRTAGSKGGVASGLVRANHSISGRTKQNEANYQPKTKQAVGTPAPAPAPAPIKETPQTPLLLPTDQPKPTAARIIHGIWDETMPPEFARWSEFDSSPRADHADAALERRSADSWRAIFQRIALSDFCRGHNDRGWKADLDWAIRPGGKKPEPALTVLEGKYDNRNSNGFAEPKRPVIRGEGYDPYAT